MSERKTISDSKKAFYNAFSSVIPPIYRRITDELLVELHLLSHSNDFEQGAIFAVGLCKVFDAFTRGYRPEKHLVSLFEAICKSNGFDPASLRDKSIRTQNAIKGYSFNEILLFLKTNGVDTPEILSGDVKALSKGNKQYSRIITIGLLSLLEEASKGNKSDKESINSEIKEICEIFGFQVSRVERDIKQYTTNLEKLEQALDLFKESVAYERKKKESKVSTVTEQSNLNHNTNSTDLEADQVNNS